MKRREAVALMAFCISITACATTPERENAQSETIVGVQTAPDGYRLSVDGQPVERQQLAAATLEGVIRHNSGLRFEDFYREGRVVICAEQDVRFAHVQDVLRDLTMEGFANLGVSIAGRDCTLP